MNVLTPLKWIRVRTILVFGNWVLGNICRYWTVLLVELNSAVCCEQFQVIEKHVDCMLAKLPQLNKTCDEFIKQAHDINTGYIY